MAVFSERAVLLVFCDHCSLLDSLACLRVTDYLFVYMFSCLLFVCLILFVRNGGTSDDK